MHDRGIASLHLYGTGPHSGFVRFIIASNGSLYIHGKLSGIPPSPNERHGIHIHECGDLSRGCDSTNWDFNPTAEQDGSEYDSNRPYGDLGNVRANSLGEIDIEMYNNVVSLNGRKSIVGRALVVRYLN